MKYKIVMIMLVMAFLFAVSTASAGDVNDTAVTSVNMELMESQNIEIDGDNLQTSKETLQRYRQIMMKT